MATYKVDLEEDGAAAWKEFMSELALRYLRTLRRDASATFARANATAVDLMERSLACTSFARACTLSRVGVRWLAGDRQEIGGEMLSETEESTLNRLFTMELPEAPSEQTWRDMSINLVVSDSTLKLSDYYTTRMHRAVN